MAFGAREPDPITWETKIDYTGQFFEPGDDVQLSRIQVLYVPVYSSILTGEGGAANRDGGDPVHPQY